MLRAIVTVASGFAVVPAPGATVHLVGSQRQAVTDGNGVARVEGLMEGDYTIDVASSIQASLRLAPTRVVVSVAPPADVAMYATVMSTQEAIRVACGPTKTRETRGILVVTVTRNDSPEPRARVLVRSDVDPLYAASEVKPKSDGTFRICGVPRGEGLTVLAVLPGRAQVKTHATIAGDHMLETVHLALPPSR